MESPPYVYLSVPNRSLGPVGRRWVLGVVAATTFGVAAGAALLGAWPVMPFAGLEVALVALAFHVVQRHDSDYERLEIGEYEVRVDAREARHRIRFVANRAWARVVVSDSGMRCTLRISYGGRSVPLGRLLSDEGRRELVANLKGRIALVVR